MKHSLENHLDLVEQKFNEVAVVLASGDAQGLAQASAALQALAVEMAELLTPLPRLRAAPAAQLLRIRALSDGMVVLRDNLARRAAYVNQALKVVVPTPAKSTYGHSSSPFGGVVQQSGQFKVLAA
jgi:hypothetical protein